MDTLLVMLRLPPHPHLPICVSQNLSRKSTVTQLAFESPGAAARAASEAAFHEPLVWPPLLQGNWVLSLSPAGQMAYLSVALSSRKLSSVREAITLVTRLLQVRLHIHCLVKSHSQLISIKSLALHENKKSLLMNFVIFNS